MNEEQIKILSNKRKYEFEPQGSVLVKEIRDYEWRKDVYKKVKGYSGKVLTVLGISEFREFIVLVNNPGQDPIVFNLREDEVVVYVPIKNMEGLFIPINMPKEAESYYFGCATMNGNHNAEIINLIVMYTTDKITYEIFYNTVTKKYL